MSDLTPPDASKRDVLKAGGVLAGGKGKLALLVIDAGGVLIAGIKATGGLTQLQYRPESNTWDFAGAFSGPEVLEGSWVLRNLLGTMPDVDESQDASADYQGSSVAGELPRRQPGQALAQPCLRRDPHPPHEWQMSAGPPGFLRCPGVP